MRRLLERMLDPDTFLKVWAGFLVAWLVVIGVLIFVAAHFIGKHW